MAKRNMTNKLIDKSSVTEELKQIPGSLTDYIDRHGNVYKDYGIWKRCEPSFNDGFITDVLFDTYEEALEAKNKKNKE